MTWKKAIVVALVIVLVVIGLPILMSGMDMATCVDCGPAVMTGPCLPLLLGTFALLIAMASFLLRRRRTDPLELLRAVLFDRPPQLA